MKTIQKERLIALSPHSEGMVATAMIWKPDDLIQIAGAWEINRKLREWVKDPPARNIVIILKNILATNETKSLLKSLAAETSSITWVGSNWPEKLSKDFFDQNGIRYETAEDLLTATWRAFHPDAGFNALKDAFHDLNEELFSVLNYLTDRCLMQFGNTHLMVESIKAIRGLKGKPARISSFPEIVRNALIQYCQADFPYLEGKSEAILHLKSEIAEIGPADITTLILGETGSGKEAVAFFLHDFSPRRGKPFVALNCAGLEENVLRSELFGHERGSFTGATERRRGLVEEAEGGTLFLDEITEMPLSIQADLLRFLQTRHYRRFGSTKEQKADIRIIAAGQPELKTALASGAFRKDLYFRIADIELQTPALREVPEDIFRVIRHVVFKQYVRHGLNIDIEQELEYFEKGRAVLEAYSWPGNFRELVSLVVNLRLKLGRDVIETVRDRSRNPLACGAYAPPLNAGDSHPSPTSDTGTQGTLEQAMSWFVSKLDHAIPADDLSRAYARASKERWPNLSFKELARLLQLAENTLRKRLL